MTIVIFKSEMSLSTAKEIFGKGYYNLPFPDSVGYSFFKDKAVPTYDTVIWKDETTNQTEVIKNNSY